MQRRLAIVTSHPIQYQAPLFRALARHVDLRVYFGHRATGEDQAASGFNVQFDWDIDLFEGFDHTFLENRSRVPNVEYFSGCDTPSVGHNLRKFKPDALMVAGWHLKCYWQAIFAARADRIPVFVRGDSHLSTPRGITKRVAKEILFPAFLRLFDAALYVGRRSRQYWEHYHFPRKRMFFSPHCVDNEWFMASATASTRFAFRRNLGIPQNAKVLLFAGKLLPSKRPADVILAAARLKSSYNDLMVMIAGSGPLEKQLTVAAFENGIPLLRLGFCNQSQMPSVYATADMLVLPSDNETWGLVANEALASGIPVVVSDGCGCAPDLVGDGTAGRSFPVGDIDSLAAAIDHILRTPPRLHVISKIIEQYSITKAIEGILAAHSFVLARSE